MGTVFALENLTQEDLSLDYVMAYDGKSWQFVVQKPDASRINNDINPGFYLISLSSFTIPKGGSISVDTIFNTWLLYKAGLASDNAFLLFSIKGSNLHVGLNGEYLRNTGVYGSNPGAVKWSYPPSNPNEHQHVHINR
ncbi:MAG TPA: hypothetical protein VEL74_01210 [Thermoanaerobaculia bacterium]|nr:hypothetical protein [Thermoanaerobaculia bacterium]